MSKFQEHQCVTLARDMPNGLLKGSHGVIVHVYKANAYEVEFFETKTSAVTTIMEDDLLLQVDWREQAVSLAEHVIMKWQSHTIYDKSLVKAAQNVLSLRGD